MREPSWTEVDGVPVAWVDLPGPLRAALYFRVGVADETAPLHGVTHLVEHLALHEMHDRPYALNGVVDLTRTAFLANGRPEEIAEFLGSVCGRLGRLPAERVEVERGVLRAESASRAASYRDGLLFWRYGAQAHGLPGMTEYGLNWLDAKTVQWWAARRFTRRNALLVLTGPPPAGLRLPLPDGPAHEPLRAVPVETVVPGWAAVPAEGIALGATVPRTYAAPAAAAILDAELNRVLRFERGITYSVGAGYEAVDADTAHVVFSADAPEERHGELRDGFLEVVEHLGDAGPEQYLLDRVNDRRTRADEEDRALGMLDSLGRDFALGRPLASFHHMDAGVSNVSLDEVTRAIRALAESAIYLVPAPLALPSRYPELPGWSRDTVSGDVHRGRHVDGALVVGAEGVSVVREGQPVTVRWTDAVATLWWADGGRVVVGRDGFRVTIAPQDWHNGAAAVARVDQLTPRPSMVPMEGPGPQPAPAPEKETRSRPWLLGVGNVWVYLLAVSLIVAGVSGPTPATATEPEFTASDATRALAFGSVFLALNIWWTVWLVRRHRAGR